LGFDFFERGLRVAVLDLDTQRNTSKALVKFSSGYTASRMFLDSPERLREAFVGLPAGPLLSVIAGDQDMADVNMRDFDDVAPAFKASVEALADCGFDVVLIDTAPALNVSLAAALYAADFVLSPIQMEAFSIDGIEMLLTVISNVSELNPKLKFLGMLPNMVDSRDPRQVRNLAELRAAYPELMIPHSIGRRGSIADAMAHGIPVWQIKKTTARKAAQEVRAVAAYVYEQMEIAV
jgi:chromosome partitioning protein